VPGERPSWKINGQAVPLDIAGGFARIRRLWKAGDLIELDLPMPIRRVLAREAVRADAGRVALERGPIVYCLEGVDHGGHVHDIVLPDGAKLVAEHRQDLLGGVTVLCGEAKVIKRSADGRTTPEAIRIMAVPYYAWQNRGPGAMTVWTARTAEKAAP